MSGLGFWAANGGDAGLGHFVRMVVLLLEATGTATILIGAALAVMRFGRRSVAGDEEAYRCFRAELGRSILLGLEFLVAADILKSLVIDPKIGDLVVLAGLIGVRTFLSVSLGVEINGHWPWQETRLSREAALAASEPGGASAKTAAAPEPL